MKWTGVMPAMTTCFDQNLRVDHAFMKRHAQWLLANGCTGIIALGSLGEAATLTNEEKNALLKNIVATAKESPVIAAISALSTVEAVALAKMAEQAGCAGLMVLPPYVYRGDWREMKAHIAAIFEATRLSCMLYNNPVSYGTDFLPEQIAELAAEHENFAAVKESTTDVRRVTAIRALVGDRLRIFVGVDDAIVEGVAAGAVGWVAGLVNAFPAESVALFNAAVEGRDEDAFALYRWFLPLLRMDTVPKFIQLIKQVQQETGTGNARVRAPRLEVVGAELEAVRAAVNQALANPPSMQSTAFPQGGE
ncbi:MAG TPA: dihydrodipicolinate synthase family protein [Terracidiphilus sp.]|nr:dihydrodipicolinate synthase family protein [Terracidiphilus sp.]